MAKGVVLDFNLDAQILLKVEKIGTLVDTGRKTARIKFAPKLKIDGFKFIGAPIQTKSGVRGKIDKVARDGLVECTCKDNVHMGDTFLFPVSATLVLPVLFKQLNLLFKPLEIGIDGSVEATISTVDAAAAVKDELAVSYKEVAPRWQKLDLRRGVVTVVIHEGRPSLVTLPNPLESAYSSVELKPIKRRKFSVCEVREIFGEEVKKVQISEEVKEKHNLDRPGEEAMVINDDEELLSKDRAFELFTVVRQYW
ncbi:uncharacterized protein LOC113302959 [Papaver somniferum]|uniref:uncharacterized protein LOC113302959 n=1 Tax=Papaver somniferum TaxID=3469 RepID=UPI000E6F9A17|nr:uncharacterized protein LOC113302959 [Papaver somniferum]XP_026407718.1 uncharacterized protein LOC113302959 [Papaver somniferum]XP_026407719.1 uncharacterized protein LOC113302959 [Papaver somniferum]XP_026407720.1 uncharacterized protein LOC113302959 [Papaver somniferum]XP_026407721.1 uncharacterized protein LOC113302959 [Papaver somniferum]XP_026407722.1 uncharacterized protein LOC113302959 [Papaver somniferum]